MNVHSSSSRRRLGKEHANQTWTTFIQNMRPFAALEGLGADWLRLGLGGHVKRAVVLYSCAAGEISRSANMSDCRVLLFLEELSQNQGGFIVQCTMRDTLYFQSGNPAERFVVSYVFVYV